MVSQVPFMLIERVLLKTCDASFVNLLVKKQAFHQNGYFVLGLTLQAAAVSSIIFSETRAIHLSEP